MKYFVEYFDGIPVLIEEGIEDNFLGVGEVKVFELNDSSGYQTTSTKLQEQKQIHSLQEVILKVSKSFSAKMQEAKSFGLAEISIEISIGFEKKLGLWCLGVKGKLDTTLKLTWKND